jgi:hypothetical protein
MNDWGPDVPPRGREGAEWEPHDWLPDGIAEQTSPAPRLVARNDRWPTEPHASGRRRALQGETSVSSLLRRISEVDEAVSSSAERVAVAVGSIARTARLPSRRDHT